MSTEQDMKDVARYILQEHLREHESRANSAMARTVYVAGTPTHEDASALVRIVEDTLKAHIMTEALFHDGAAKRFRAALADLDAK